MERPTKRVAVIMQRRAIDNRWQSEVWEPVGVLSDYAREDAPRQIVDEPGTAQWLYPNMELSLHRAEAEGYFHNVSTPAPNVFVLWRMEDERAVPHYVTVSYDEGSRWMDGSAQVDPVPMPSGLRAWVVEFVQAHYRPGPKKRIKPQSFLSPKDRART